MEIEVPKASIGDASFGGKIWQDECGNKIAHFTLDDAKAAIYGMRRDGVIKEPSHLLCIYQCRFCDWFHLGHKRNAPRKKLWDSTVVMASEL